MLLTEKRRLVPESALNIILFVFLKKFYSWIQNTTSTHSDYGGPMYHLLLLCWDTERDWALRRAPAVSVIRPRVAIRLPPPAPWKRGLATLASYDTRGVKAYVNDALQVLKKFSFRNFFVFLLLHPFTDDMIWHSLKGNKQRKRGAWISNERGYPSRGKRSIKSIFIYILMSPSRI